ncbi:MAG: Asd/ArgC dimerization domain-containing protein [Candidatus Aminicenantaceae bacterium]
MKARQKLKLAIVGTESLRSKEIKSVLSTKKAPVETIDFFDPDVEEEYSKLTQFRGEAKVIHHLDKDSFQDVDLVFLAADKKVNREYGILTKEKKIQAIDLSETFNMDSEVPVVVSGVNDEIILKKRPPIIANPHPVTVIISHLFQLIMQKYGLCRAVAFVLQPVSAFEDDGINELVNQSIDLLNSSSLSKKVFRDQIAFNLLSHTEHPEKDGFCPVEKQIIQEIKRVFNDRKFSFSLSLIQAPVFHTYSIMSFLELRKKTDIQGLENLFKDSAFFKLYPPSSSCPVSSVSVAGKDKIFIGQIKKEESFPNSFWVWSVADNLIRGSALNAFDIAHKIFSSYLT